MNMLVERAKVEEKVENNGEETEKERGKVGCLHGVCARAGDSEEEENKLCLQGRGLGRVTKTPA